MGLYGEHVVPRIVDVACNMKEAHPQRRRACAGLAGHVLEIGFGSGLNVPHYPAAVTGVTAVEPSDVGWRLAERRVATAHVPVRRAGVDGQSLPPPPHRREAGPSTLTPRPDPDAPGA